MQVVPSSSRWELKFLFVASETLKCGINSNFYLDCMVKHLIPKVKQNIRWKLADLLFACGWKGQLLQPKHGQRMICYHGIDLEGRKVNSRFLQRDVFEQQLVWMKENCNILSIEDYFSKRQNTEQLNLCLSFDDGYANNFQYVLPLLEKYELPATFYVSPSFCLGQTILWNDLIDLLEINQPEIVLEWAAQNGLQADFRSIRTALMQSGTTMIQPFVDDLQHKAAFMTDSKWDDYWRLMDSKQIMEAARHPLVTIGSHTCRHPNLTTMAIDDAVEECKMAKKCLEDLLDVEILDFAFPYGAYNTSLVAALEGIGHSRLACLDIAPADTAGMDACRGRMTNNAALSTQVQLMEYIRGSYY